MRHASTTCVREIAVAVSRCWLRAAPACASALLSPVARVPAQREHARESVHACLPLRAPA
jgi:hypothetical protein